ncbi:tonB-system energizer ExbB [Brevundimonas sp. LM2]|uniref:tonB-system energizer ExbB n=1 Tax=Brevundimonas sp. LM2 TaxID=1938605 RepID=UPI001C0C026A|nr:tonB-system energizer ExbB [Brevundimonas sp. LM2]
MFIVSTSAVPTLPAAPTAPLVTAAVAEGGGSALAPVVPENLTVWRMFAEADPIVQAVMLLLVAASLLTWTIWIAKSGELASAKRALKADLATLTEADRLAALKAAGHGPVGDMIAVARAELAAGADVTGLQDRIEARLQRIEVAAVQKMMRGTNIVATIASAGPFIGLFGTVWGIMNAFIGISQTQTTNLAVVAPGIAEALLATALGLVAAIPAVVIYNGFARSVADYRRLVGDASTLVAVLVSRQVGAGSR